MEGEKLKAGKDSEFDASRTVEEEKAGIWNKIKFEIIFSQD